MISEERSNHASKQALNFPVGLLIRSPKKRLAKLGRKPSNGSLQSNTSEITSHSAESVTVRQPAKNKIRRHNNNRLSTVFARSPVLRDGGQGQGSRALVGDLQVTEDPAELSSQVSAPGILKIFGSDICQGTNYKSVLATTLSSAKELVKEALERYCLEKEDPGAYVLCDVIGQTGVDYQWKTECFRVVGDHEKPLMLQSLWKPKEGFSRRFEIQKRASVEEQCARETDTVTAGINAQARKLQKIRSRVTSLFVDSGGMDADPLGMWRSISEMDLSAMGKEARRAQSRPPGREEPEAEADKEAHCTEKEETESSDDNATQYSIHPPLDCPYFLLLQGYSYRQDFVIYLMSGLSTVFGCCSEHSAGEDEERLKVDVLLFAPDILPQHCCVRRQDGAGNRTLTLLKPVRGAPVTQNGVPLKEEAELRPGDLVGLGRHYLFMFKDLTALGEPRPPPWMTLCPSSCEVCGSPLSEAPRRTGLHRKLAPPRWKDPEGRDLCLLYEPEQEDKVLEEILIMVDPNGNDPKLTPAFLLILCIQRSAAAFESSQFRKLLLQVASQIQLTTWEKTKELAAIQPETNAGGEQEGPDEARLMSVRELIPGLRPLVLWMANSVELLHFMQHEVPQLLPWGQEEEEQGLVESQTGSTRTACEEAMTVLEEVIMFTFQQSVYYLTKSMYPALPGLLEGNPFSDSGQLRMPEGVDAILDVLKGALGLLGAFQVHPEITSQLFAYLFFFTNASLFNALMERGSGGGFYQWSRGVQIRANLDMVMDWVQGIGLGDLALDFFQKLSSAVNLLATPKENLLQSSWSSLRAEFTHLNPAQLHHMLREYNPGRACPSHWTPPPEEAEEALRTGNILESFDNHPPLILPSNAFHLELGRSIGEPALFAQLARLQDFIRLLPSRESDGDPRRLQQSCPIGWTDDVQSASRTKAAPQPALCPALRSDEVATGPPPVRGPHADLCGCEAVLTQKLKSLELQNALPGQADLGCHKSLALDPSCLLTPPNTPQGMEPGELEADLRKGEDQQAATPQRRKGCPDPNSKSTEDVEEREEVFIVELLRGPHGLGLALVDGMKTPLRMSGIYIKSIVPDSPAALCGKLRLGDRVLAVNGVSLVGVDYHVGRELIRSSEESLRLLVAKTDPTLTATGPHPKC